MLTRIKKYIYIYIRFSNYSINIILIFIDDKYNGVSDSDVKLA